MKRLCVVIIILTTGCVSIPRGVTPVEDFDIDAYLGTWYEIARLDHSFERGLTRVSAEYSQREDGSIQVVNRGYDPELRKWKQVSGKGRFVSDRSIGRLKVSFFGPFYGAYNIIDLDPIPYSHALICGPNTSYLWVLARRKTLDPAILGRLVEKARSAGFDTERLIYVRQD